MPLLLATLAAAVAGVLIVWFLVPRTPDAFGSARNALAARNELPAATQGTGPAAGLPVFTYDGPASTAAPSPSGAQVLPPPVTASAMPGTGVPGPATPTPEPTGPAQLPTGQPTLSPGQSSPSARPSRSLSATGTVLLRDTPYPASSASFPGSAIGSDVAKARAYSPTIAVEIGQGDAFAVAPVTDQGGPSAAPLVLAAALLGALACLSGALLSRRRVRWEPIPSGGSAPAHPVGHTAGHTAALPAGVEPVAGAELSRLRRGAQQKTALARSMAELMPSLPEALVWRAQKALADVGVRPIVPDGQLFDEAVHHVVGTEPVPRGGRENTIARTIRPGYADDEKILVYPKVIVYADDTGGRTR
jgi:GrpE